MDVKKPACCLYEPCICLEPEAAPPGCVNTCSAIHMDFGLSYASYLVLPRSILQSMPSGWQARFVAMLDEAADRFGDIPREGEYHVQLRDENGRFVSDPLADYERGRRRIEPRSLTG